MTCYPKKCELGGRKEYVWLKVANEVYCKSW